MSLCTPAMTWIFWVVIIFTAIAGLWLIVRRNRITREHNLWLVAAEEKLKEHMVQNDVQTSFIREEYEQARKDYLEMMKEMQSKDIPDPSGLNYMPD